MTRDDDYVGNRIKTPPVSFVMIEIPEEDTGCGMRGKLVGNSGGRIRVAAAFEDTNMLIGRHDAKQGEVRSGVGEHHGG